MPRKRRRLEGLIFSANIVYHLVDEYKEWVEKERSVALKKEMSTMVLPGKIMVLPTYIFRKSKPAVFGVRVLAGRIRRDDPMLRKDGQRVGTIMQIQDQGESIEEATVGKEAAVSMENLQSDVASMRVTSSTWLCPRTMFKHYSLSIVASFHRMISTF